MTEIDAAAIRIEQSFSALMGVMVAFMMFGVALDLKWQHFTRVIANPKTPSVGLMAQLIALPALAFASGLVLTDTDSVAVGLLLVAACPAGALSNYLTTVVRGNAAASVSMTAVGTLASVLATPLIFGFWVSMNPRTSAFLRETLVDLKLLGVTFLIGMAIPVSAGMLLNARRPELSRRMRPWIRRGTGVLFIIVVGMVFSTYVELVLDHARQALLPVAVTQLAAVAAGWAMARAARVPEGDQRAIVLEVAGQNVALGLAMAVAFFPGLGGVAITIAAWGFTQIVIYLLMAAAWSRSRATRSNTASENLVSGHCARPR